MRWFRRKHTHDYGWSMDQEGKVWIVSAICACGRVAWTSRVWTTDELREDLDISWQRGELSNVGYFTAPTHIPEAAAA